MNPSLRLLCVLFLLGPACARRVEPPVATAAKPPKADPSCCTGVHGCLELLGDSKGPVQNTIALPLERLEPLKQCAAQKLARQGPEAHAGLVALLSHADPQVRSGAALGLSLANVPLTELPPDAVPALLQALRRGPPELPLTALLRLDDARAEPALRRYLQEGPTLRDLPCAGRTLTPVVLDVLEAADLTPPVLGRGADILCGASPKNVPRVRALLRRELARPTLWRSSAPQCQEPAPRTCQAFEDECMPYAGAIAQALTDGLRQEVYPEFLQALARDDERLTPLILYYLTRAEAESPELDAWRARLLESPVPDCRQHALHHLRTPPPQAHELLRSLLERGAPWERQAAAALLSRDADDKDLAALLRALDDPHMRVQAEAARALGRMKEKASVALPRLDALASTHASPVVRLSAAMARFRMTGQWKPPRAYACPSTTKLEGDSDEWVLNLRAGPLRLHGFRYPAEASATEASGPCAGISIDLRHPHFVPMDSACLILNPTVEGVFASTWVSEKGRHFRLDHFGPGANPNYVLEFHGKRLLFHGLAHLGYAQGDVSEVTRTPQGGWMLAPFASLPGYPFAYAVDSQGDLVVATMSGILLENDPSTENDVPRWYAEAFGAACDPVVRITPDGQVFDVE